MNEVLMKAYKYRIYPNGEQKVLIEKHFGCARFTYNWALALQQKHYEEHKKSLGIDLGLSHLLILSNGEKFDNPKYLKKAQNRLSNEQKIFARKKKESKNYQKNMVKNRKLAKSISDVAWSQFLTL